MDKFLPFIERHWALSVLFVVLFIAIIFYEKRTQKHNAGGVKPEEAVRLMNKSNAVVIDIRAREAFASGHIIKSRHIPLVDLPQSLKSLQKLKQKPIIIVAEKQVDVAQAIKQLKANGFTQVGALSGGLKAWCDAKLPLEKESS